MKLLFISLFLLQVWRVNSEEAKQPPHIILIYADDFGWNDVSFHGSPEIPTPNIDALAMSGITLHTYYGEATCTPSRAALMSGKYPMRLGLQHYVSMAGQRSGLPLDVTTLPQHLKNLGYATHIVGKWHLGYHTTAHFPTNRGFDTFFGYMNGFIGYYDFTFYQPTKPKGWFGIDLYNGTQPIKNFRAQYTPYVFADHAKDIILNHDSSKPMFLYIPQLAVHSGNEFQPHQAPPEKVAEFKWIKDVDRRIHAAVVSTLDDTVGTIFDALGEKDMLNNSIVLVVSDNGAEVLSSNTGAGSNYPLKGNKNTFWEGAIHVPAVIWSPLLNLDEPRVSNQLMHATDWLPTLYSAANGDPKDLGSIDGVDMWEALMNDLPSPRTQLLNNLDQVYGTSAFRMGDLKLVNGSNGLGYDTWYGPTGFEYYIPDESMYQWVFKRGSPVRDILQKNGWWIVKDPDAQLYERAKVTCQQPPPEYASNCRADFKPCLFNITADPCEYEDLAEQHQDVVISMMQSIEAYMRESLPPNSMDRDPWANPLCHGFVYAPWMDPGQSADCDVFQK
ncbi:hypothetical protein JTE90_008200 [Oedothorax gibbosus]|uniref:Sulfatase N-terminal domain-containing protein n=1 Tax=Oedothorax gibbosus TaxID=931172 RepID=A0AAV6VEL2_9ARAC|nr:hypothetical protein JTE90_008200 [Oedothorax gibbosus]